MKSLLKKIVPLLLTLGLLFGLQSTVLAADAATTLSNVGYIGNSANCSMSADMAEAYATKLLGDEGDALVLLIDPANDGKPLMMTYAENKFYLWAWDGTRAYCYEIDDDAETDVLTSYFTGTYQGQGAIYVAEGAMEDGPTAYGSLVYTVSNGNLRLAHRHMTYTAEPLADNPTVAVGDSLPLVQLRYFSNRYASAYTTDLILAGYIQIGDYLVLSMVDGKPLSFDNFDEYDAWFNDHETTCFKPNEMILTNKGWTDYRVVRQALADYAAIERQSGGATFADVPSSHYAYTPVQWAVENGITVGTSATTFSPNQTCSNAHILTFLWRALGEPAPGIVVNPFKDVRPSDYYYEATLWAYQNHIISGEYFYPDSACTRSMAVYYFWLLHGCPEASTDSFADVPSDATYAQAVSWAVEQGITYGTSSTTFSPYEICTRAQIVSFLHRMMA